MAIASVTDISVSIMTGSFGNGVEDVEVVGVFLHEPRRALGTSYEALGARCHHRRRREGRWLSRQSRLDETNSPQVQRNETSWRPRIGQWGGMAQRVL
jgi:hypothetical protein